MNNTDKTSLEEFTKELSILHYALTFGAFMIALLIYFFTIGRDGEFNFSDTSDYFLYICPLLAIWGVFGGSFLFKKRLAEIDPSSDLDYKLASYRAAAILRFALLEGPALICIIASMETKNLLYLVIALVLIIYLFSLKVSEEKIVEELEL